MATWRAVLLAGASFALLLAAAHGAGNLDSLGNLGQGEYRLLVRDLGAATSYKYLASTAPLGVIGFDMAFTATATELRSPELWQKASTASSIPDTLPTATVRFAKGLAEGVDVGATCTEISGTQIALYGAELRWAAIAGGRLAPTVGLRLSYTQLSGVDDLRLATGAVDLAVSRRFAAFTPYAGVGKVRTVSRLRGRSAGLAPEEVTQSRSFAGAHFSLHLMDFTIEAERTGGTTGYAARLGFRF